MSTEPDWRLADCAAVVEIGWADPDDWFPTTTEQRNYAMDVCEHCPLKRECLAYGKVNNLDGVWGGEELVAKFDTCSNCGRAQSRPKPATTYCTSCRTSISRGEEPSMPNRPAFTAKDLAERDARIRALTNQGYSETQIAAKLSISPRTVTRYHLQQKEEAA